jgi:hypothetical protein
VREETLRRLVERAIEKIEEDIRAHSWNRRGAQPQSAPPPEREVSDEAASVLRVSAPLREAVSLFRVVRRVLVHSSML